MKHLIGLLFTIFTLPAFAQVYQWQQPGTNMKFGSKTSVDKLLVFDINAGTANPRLKANTTTGHLQYSNDGTNFKDIGSGGGSGSGINLLTNNPDFELGTNFWTNSGGTLTAVTSTSNLLFDTGSATFVASASGQYFQSELVTIPYGLDSAACLAAIYAKNADGNLKLQVVDSSGTQLTTAGTNVEVVLASGFTTPNRFAVGFKCPTAGTQIRIKVISTAASATVAFDKAKIGDDDRMFSAQQVGGLVASAYQPGATSCLFSTTSASFVTATASASCPQLNTIELNPGPGTASTANGSGIPGQFTVNNLPDGYYEITMSAITSNATTGNAALMRITDGTTNGPLAFNSQPTSNNSPQFTAYLAVSYTTTGNHTFNIQLASPSGTTANLVNNSTNTSITFKIVRTPPNRQNTYIQATAPADNTYINDFTASVSSAAAIISQNVTWLSGCTGTSPFTCTFSSGVFSAAPNCTMSPGNSSGVTAGVPSGYINSVTSTTVVVNTLNTAGSSTAGNFTVHCQRNSADYKLRATILAAIPGVSNSTAAASYSWDFYFGGASITTTCTSTPCTIYANTGPTTTVTRSAAGSYQVSVTAGLCSTTLACQSTSIIPGTGTTTMMSSTAPTTTSWSFNVLNSNTTVAADAYGSVHCGCKQ